MNKRIIRKLLSVMITVLMIPVFMICLTGCGSDSDKLVLAVRSGTYADVIKECLPGFEEKYGISCEVIELTEDELHSEILNHSLDRKGKYDIVMVDGSWVAEFIAEDVLLNLSSSGYSYDDDIIPATTEICVQNGSIYLVPYYGNVTVMLYNRTVAEDLGYDTDDFDTLEDLLAFCTESSAVGHGGFVIRGDTENNIVVDFLPVLRAFGGWVVDDNNNPTINTSEFRSALEYYLKLVKTGKVLSKDELIASIESGSNTVAVGWPGWYNATSAVNSDYIPFPGRNSASSSASYNCNVYGIWTLGIPQNCKDKESALKLLTYLTDPEVQMNSVSSGGVPCRYSCLTDPELTADNPHLEVICSALENGIYRPNIQEWPGFYTILGTEMKKIISGELSIDDGLMLAQEELETYMN